jgi:hypothetical protein
MQSTRLISVGAFILVLLSQNAVAQSKDGDSLYKLLATTRTGTMQKEVDEAAAQGYRILMGSPTSGNEMALFMHRVATPGQTYSYKLLATSRTGTMQKELNEVAEGGFRLMLSTMIAKKQLVGPVEIVLLMEKPPKVEKQYEYKLLATNHTGTLQKEVAEAEAAGFVIVGMVSRGEHMVVMEKETILSK